MKKITIILITLFFYLISKGQYTITGTIKDTKDNAISYTTISLLNLDSTLTGGTISDEDGKYNLNTKAGNYILRVSFIGYDTHYQNININTNETINVTLKEVINELQEVEVKAKRQLIERQFDKIVLNVSQSAFAIGSNGKELLKKAPGVNVDKDGNVTVNGKSVEVYIDGRPSNLSGEQLKAMLEGTDGSTIEKIEIMSNPSAKYDASGRGGIINIKTKRNMMQGFNGTVSASYGGMYYGDVKKMLNQEMISANLNYRSEKTYTFLNLSQFYNNQKIGFYTYNSTIDSIANIKTEREDVSEYDIEFQYYLIKLGNDWYINKKNILGFIFQSPFMFMTQDVEPGHGYGYTKVNNDVLSRNGYEATNPMNHQQYNANINYTHTFSDSLSQELTINLDYNRFNSKHNNEHSNTYYSLETGDVDRITGMKIYTGQKIDIYSAKLDFQSLFWNNGMVEAGAKWAMSNTYNKMTNDTIIDAYQSPHWNTDFNYSEQVSALYVSFAKQFGKKFSAKLGLRGEYTYAIGTFKEPYIKDLSKSNEPEPEVRKTKQSYFNLFPTAFLGYTPTDMFSMNVSYTRRIKRANYFQLNPFRSYVNAYSYSEGNPDLTPEFNNQVDLNFMVARFMTIAFNFSHTQNMFSQLTEVLPNGYSRMKWVNFGTCTTHGGNISLTELPIIPKYMTMQDGSKQKAGAWLTITLNGGYYYFINRSYDGNYLNRSHWGYGSATLNTYLPQDWTISIDGSYQAPIVSGYQKNSESYYLGLGVRKFWRKPGLIFNLQVQDLLRSLKNESTTCGLAEGSTLKYYHNYRAQKITLGVTWMFGQQQYYKKRNTGNIDEASRLGGGGSMNSSK